MGVTRERDGSFEPPRAMSAILAVLALAGCAPQETILELGR